jgi:hypothetical protein
MTTITMCLATESWSVASRHGCGRWPSVLMLCAIGCGCSRLGWDGTQRTAGAFCKCGASPIKGGYYAFHAFGHWQRRRFDDGGHGCVGSKQHGRKDARPHHAKDAPGEEHQTGSIRICARSPQAEVQVTISVSIHAESQNYPDYNWSLKTSSVGADARARLRPARRVER